MRRAALLLCLLLPACKSAEGPRTLDGTGATLPFPLYTAWATELSREIRVNYQPLGSGAGMRQVSDGVVDFGATDEPMTDDQLKASTRELVHVPMTIGAVVLCFNVAGVAELRLAPDVIADVFRGALTRWDDARLRDANPGVTLPPLPIAVVHRADGSGTSATFTAYLAKNSDAWRTKVGASALPRFPVGIGARGNDGVAAYVKSTPGAIGYVELAYARQSNLATALVRNRASRWTAPTLEALDHAVRSVLGRMPADLRVSIVDAEDAEAYPIAALSFIVLPRDAKERKKGEALGRFVWWGLHDGQKLAAALDYAPLPAEIVTRAEVVVRGLKAEGQPLGRLE